MTMARPTTSPISGAPGLASPVVMSRAVAAEGAWCEPANSKKKTVRPTPSTAAATWPADGAPVSLIEGYWTSPNAARAPSPQAMATP